jgi:hypothetical protein
LHKNLLLQRPQSERALRLVHVQTRPLLFRDKTCPSKKNGAGEYVKDLVSCSTSNRPVQLWLYITVSHCPKLRWTRLVNSCLCAHCTLLFRAIYSFPPVSSEREKKRMEEKGAPEFELQRDTCWFERSRKYEALLSVARKRGYSTPRHST